MQVQLGRDRLNLSNHAALTGMGITDRYFNGL